MALSAKKALSDKKHHEKLDNIMIRPYKEKGQQIRQAAADAGQSLQGYILQAIDERMQLEKK